MCIYGILIKEGKLSTRFRNLFNPIPRGGKRMLDYKTGTHVPTNKKIRIHKSILGDLIPYYFIKSKLLILQACCKRKELNQTLLTQE